MTQANAARGKAGVSCPRLLLAFVAVLAALDFDAFAVPSRRPTRVGRTPRSPHGPRSPPSDTESAQKKLTSQLADVPSAQQLLDILDPELDGELLNEFHISAAFTRLARHKKGFDRAMQQSPVIKRLVAKVLSALERDELFARASANVFWAIASLGEGGSCILELIPALTQSLVVQTEAMKPQEVANAIWAAATLQLPDKELRRLLPKLACRVLEQTSEFNAQHVANTIWATATLKGRAPELLEIHEVLAEMAVERAADFKPQELSNILWSAATLKTDVPCLLEVLPRLMEGILGAREKYNAQGVANTIWAIATLMEEVPVLQQLLPDILTQVPCVEGLECTARLQHSVGGRIAAQRSRTALERGDASLAKSIDCSAQQC